MIAENTDNTVFFVLSHYIEFTLIMRQDIMTSDNICYVNLKKMIL